MDPVILRADSPAIEAASLYIGLNLVILLVLAVRISLKRRKSQISLGDGGDSALMRLIRVHGNATEWVPAALIGLLVVAMLNAPLIAIHVIGAALTLARVLHAWGLGAGEGPTIGRVAGSALTMLVYIALAAGLIGHALV